MTERQKLHTQVISDFQTYITWIYLSIIYLDFIHLSIYPFFNCEDTLGFHKSAAKTNLN